jgi:hypothetical protein
VGDVAIRADATRRVKPMKMRSDGKRKENTSRILPRAVGDEDDGAPWSRVGVLPSPTLLVRMHLKLLSLAGTIRISPRGVSCRRRSPSTQCRDEGILGLLPFDDLSTLFDLCRE